MRLGVLIDSLLSRYQGRLMHGAMRAASRQGARVIGFQGSFLNRGGEPHAFDGSFLYELAGPSAVDGLVVVSNILASAVGIEPLRSFCASVGVPVVSIGDLPGFPAVCIDSRDGLSAAITHLVKVHTRRKLAFIRGHAGNPESAEREQIFRTTLAVLGVPVDERLVLPGTFLETSGANAIRVLFDERGVARDEVDAIVSANDQMAVGAARELRAMGLRTPEDLALIGFDDDDHARSNSPPLTTVSQPVERVGAVAVELLLQRLLHRAAPERVVLRAEPVFRRSCGCSQARSAAAAERRAFSAAVTTDLASGRSELLKELDHLGAPAGVERGVDSLLRALTSNEATAGAHALADFEQALFDSYEAGLDPLRWEDVLARFSAVARQTPAPSAHAWLDLEGLLGRARLLSYEVAARFYSTERLCEIRRANALRILGSALACVRSQSAIASAVETGLPGLGVRYCCVCLFVDSSARALSKTIAHYEDAGGARRELLHDTGDLWRLLPGSVPPSAARAQEGSSIFPTPQRFGGARAPASSALDLLIYPLVFAERALGYVVFDAPKQIDRAWLLENVAGHLSGAVYTLARADELREARALAARANAAKGEFVAMMSHEVRTPLNAIHGHLELCLRTELSLEQESHLTRAQTSSRSLLRIVDDILDFSKIEAKRLELESEPFAIQEVLEQLSGTFALVAQRKNLELVFDVHADGALHLLGDPLRVLQVLMNLIGNALKFTERGYVVLTVKIGVEHIQPGTVEFSVTDTGIGMNGAELERVFDPFTQADSSMTRRYGGTGLGLSISKRLVEIMGGKLSVLSTPGQGSQFRFTLPYATVEQPKTVAPTSLVGLRVLIVEDCQPQAEALQRILAQIGGEVRVAASGSAGLSAFRTALTDGRVFDLVLVARTLPDMEGIALIARLRRALPPTELTALVVGPSESEFWATAAFRQAGASATIAKPFYSAAVRRAIARGRSQDRGTRRASVVRAASEQSLRGWSVLVAQDDLVGLELTKTLLEQWGASVTCARNGRQAVACAARRTFSLILLDLRMPELDGYQAARAIRVDPRNSTTIIVALTASTRFEDQSRATAAGMDAYIRTPLESSALLAKLLQISNTLRAHEVYEAGQLESETHAPLSRADVRPLLDSAAGLARVNGDLATYHRLLQRFLKTHRDDARQIRRARAEGDAERAVLIAHTLASAAGNIGASELQRVAHGLESVLSSNGSALLDWIADLERSHEITLSAAAAAMNAYAPAAAPGAKAQAPPAELLIRTKALLEDHDTAAVELVRSLALSFGEHQGAKEPLKQLQASIEGYDFEQARLQLEALQTALALDDFNQYGLPEV